MATTWSGAGDGGARRQGLAGFTAACSCLLASVLVAGCVSRQPASGPLSGAGKSGAPRVGGGQPATDRTSLDLYHHLSHGEASDEARDGSPGHGSLEPLPPGAWPARIQATELIRRGRQSQVYLLPAEVAPPRERFAIGRQGLGELYRIDVERITSPANLDRVRRERGFKEWLVFQTYLRSLPDVTLYSDAYADSDASAGTPPETADLVEISETSFAIYLPSGAPRGLVVQLTNLSGNTEWERRLTEAFHRAGWAVLASFVPDGWALTDRMSVDRGDPPEELGRRLAEAIDDRLAEWAYGVEALLEYMAERYPQVPQTPLVGVGSSAGAISLPAVAARLAARPQGAFDAVVLIGGGIDGLSVLRNTSLQNTPLRLRWADDKRPDRAAWERIREAYFRYSRLDGVTTCAFLRHAPTLLLHAAYDRIVDAECGEALWEALGRPERWTYQTGHLGMFIFWVPLEIDRIVRWVEEQVTSGSS